MEMFHSGWEFEVTSEGSAPNTTNQIGVFTGEIYPIGLDAGWHSTDNLLIFTNSYKMKMSVLFGVFQVTWTRARRRPRAGQGGARARPRAGQAAEQLDAQLTCDYQSCSHPRPPHSRGHPVFVL